jgi:formylglycine-generating enzyme required for sulfatase activity
MGTADVADLDPPGWAGAELSSEQPAHDVQLTRGFWIDRFEVTNAAFDAFVAAGGYAERSYWSERGLSWLDRQDESLPVECAESAPGHPRACITWYEAEAYAAWRGGRLPTEAEWEFVARGPGSLIYPWGDEWDPNLANIVDSDGTVPVGSYPDGASWVGALDMSGNVMEWVADWWGYDYYEEMVGVDPPGPDSGNKKVEKGGWWGSVPYVGRAAYRHFEDPPTYQDHHIGVRIASDA